MSSHDAWMPFYVGDYLADTMHLSALQHGVYLLLLMHYWRSGPLPDDDSQLAAIAKLDQKSWKSIRGCIRSFFYLNGDGRLHQKRMDAERYRVTEISDKRREAGRRGAAGKWGGNTDGKPPDKPPGKPMANAKQMPSEKMANATDLPSGCHATTTSTDSDLEEEKEREGLNNNFSSFSEARARVSPSDQADAQAEFRAYLAKKRGGETEPDAIRDSDKIVVLNAIGKAQRAMASTVQHAPGKKAQRNPEAQVRELEHGPPELVPEGYVIPPIREQQRSPAQQLVELLGISLDEANERLAVTTELEGVAI